MMKQIPAGGSNSDLLSSIYNVEVRNEEKIPDKDRTYCQDQQDKLYQTLNQLNWWYRLFVANAERYNQSHKLKYAENGSVEFHDPHKNSNEENGFLRFEFKPFDSLNAVVELYYRAVNRFARCITEYFNERYQIRAPAPELDKKELLFGFKPKYQTYVDNVIAHLGGKSFRETAEEELIERFLQIVRPWGWDTAKPEVKGKKIVFPRAVKYSDYSWDDQTKISWSNLQDFERFCAGIYFSISRNINGHSGYIAGFDREKIDFSKQYSLSGNGQVTMKLYKNGRADITYPDNDKALDAFRILRLDSLKLPKE